MTRNPKNGDFSSCGLVLFGGCGGSCGRLHGTDWSPFGADDDGFGELGVGAHGDCLTDLEIVNAGDIKKLRGTVNGQSLVASSGSHSDGFVTQLPDGSRKGFCVSCNLGPTRAGERCQ